MSSGEPWSDQVYASLAAGGASLLLVGALWSIALAMTDGRWSLLPLALSLLLVSLGCLLVMALEGMWRYYLHWILATTFTGTVAVSLWHLLSRGAPWSGPAVIVAAVLIGLFMAAILLFFLTFRYSRLF